MFCFQCEQTAGCIGCKGTAGVCGKSGVTALQQDRLTGALITLARAGVPRTPEIDRLVAENLFVTLTNVNFDERDVSRRADAVLALVPGLQPYDVGEIWRDAEDARSLRSLILFGIRGLAAYLYHAQVLGSYSEEAGAFLYRALAALGDGGASQEELLGLAMETGKVNLAVMELLDGANTAAYGAPSPAAVSRTVEPGPFIVVSGHDLHDLELLLRQTEGTGVSIYTHGEMLPAHGYPKLRSYPHLRGNFGTAWHNQQREFADLPGAVLFTTNCLMPPWESYADRVFTTAAVAYPGLVHIGDDRDFTPVIEKALALGGYAKSHTIAGVNGGDSVMTGFAHGAVLAAAGTVVDAVKSGAIKHFFLVGGCDGAKPGRNYFTEFVQKSPADTVILTLACGKFRFNDLDIGQIGPLPRILDMGQCNDAYSAIKVALALSEAFGCGVNELPLTLVLSWYEQKAVAILLTLLSLGIKGILLGPSLPAFVSPAVLDYLVENFDVAPISTPEADLARILG